MGKLACLCCGCLTLNERGGYDICPVCFWEDDAYIVIGDGAIKGVLVKGEAPADELLSELIDVPSGANHGLTLREGRENYRKFGACEEAMVRNVRKPRRRELPMGKNWAL